MPNNIIEKLESSSHTYDQDLTTEKGKYVHECPECGKAFMGHKKRYICRLCLLSLERAS